MININFPAEIEAAKKLYPNLPKAGLIEIILQKLKRKNYLNWYEIELASNELHDRLSDFKTNS